MHSKICYNLFVLPGALVQRENTSLAAKGSPVRIRYAPSINQKAAFLPLFCVFRDGGLKMICSWLLVNRHFLVLNRQSLSHNRYSH